MGVGRNESGVQTWPNQRYTYIPTGTTRSLSKCISLTATRGSGKNNTLRRERSSRDRLILLSTRKRQVDGQPTPKKPTPYN